MKNDFQGLNPSKTFRFRIKNSLRSHVFSKTSPQGAFLNGTCADVASTGRFWYHFRFSGFPKRHPLDNLSRPTGREGSNTLVRGWRTSADAAFP